MKTEPTEILKKKPSGAQKKREWLNRKRIFENGIWRLNIWQPHERVLRGKPRV